MDTYGYSDYHGRLGGQAMKFIRTCLFLMIVMALSTISSPAQEPAVSPVLEPLKMSAAFRQYQKRPKTELSKLIFLMDRFKGCPAEVIYNGSHYDSEFALKQAKSYMAKHYKNKQPAETWIRENAYRSNPGRQVILYQEPKGQPKPLRDVLLEELEELKKI